MPTSDVFPSLRSSLTTDVLVLKNDISINNSNFIPGQPYRDSHIT